MPSTTRPTAPKAPKAPKKPKDSVVAADAPYERLAFRRLAFGATKADLMAYRAGGLTERQRFEAYVESQLHPEHLRDERCDRKLLSLNLKTSTKTLTQLWQEHALAANKLKDMAKASGSSAEKDAENDLRQRPLRETEVAAWTRAVYSRRQLQEVMVDFWHSHFSIFAQDGQTQAVFTQFDRDVVRPNALGNFREFLEQVARAPAMLFYLDQNVSQSGNPNENYARELFELHTLGVGHYLGTMDREQAPGFAQGKPRGYVDGDVYEAARCLTGWRVDGGDKRGDSGTFQYYDTWHDRFQKIVLGRRIPEHQPPLADGRQLFDLLAAHPGTAEHLARRLCQRLVADDPPQALVTRAAEVFQANLKAPDQIRRVVAVILLSKEFAVTPMEKIRRPFELVAASLRSLEIDVTVEESFLKETGRLGQRLFQWRTPDGYPDHRDRWASTTLLLERWRLMNQLANNNLPGAPFDAVKATPDSCHTPNQIADFWLRQLGLAGLGQNLRESLVSYLAQGRSSDLPLAGNLRNDRLGPGVALALMSPEFQWR